MIECISHVTFVVKDLEKMTELLFVIFNAQEVYASGENTFSLSKEKFFLIGGIWIAIMQGESLSDRTYNHLAFKIDKKDFPSDANRIEGLGLEVKRARGRIEGEGQSLYFYDHDNHLFELHTGTLEQRLLAYKKVIDQRV